MKKQILVFLMAFVVCLGLQGQNTGELKYFNLVLPDNSLISYELDNGIDIHFQDSIIMINDLNLYMGVGVKYYFSEDDINDVNDILGDDGSYVNGNKLFVKSKSDGFIVISDVWGRVVYSKPNCKECVIDLSTLTPNILYIIKVNDQSIKFVRR